MKEQHIESGKYPYLVLIMNWQIAGVHWVRGYATLDEARDAVRKKALEHQNLSDRVIIVKGEVAQLGVE